MPLSVSPLVFLAVFALSTAVVAALTPLAIRIGERYRLVDTPGGRRRHVGAIVRIGGLGLFPGFAVATLATLVLPVPRSDLLEVTRLVGILLGMAVVWITGLLDDRFRLPSWPQTAGLVIAASIAIGYKVFIELFNHPLTDIQIKVDWYLMVPITLLWIVGMTSTVNVLDGLDGLATGVTAIASLVLFVHLLRLGQHSVALLPLALLGCCLGFLPYNFGRARIFLGGGAYVLGYGLATLSIVSGAKVATALSILWLPIVDFAWQIYSRRKRNQPPALGDRGHLHLRLTDMGWPNRRIVGLYYVITAALGAIALLVSSRLQKLAILGGAALAIVALLATLAKRSSAPPTSGR